MYLNIFYMAKSIFSVINSPARWNRVVSCLTHLHAVEVIHCQNCASLILIAQKTKALGLPRLLITHQVDVDDLSVPATTKRTCMMWRTTVKTKQRCAIKMDVLWENADDVSFGQFVRKSTCRLERGQRETFLMVTFYQCGILKSESNQSFNALITHKVSTGLSKALNVL